MSLTCEQLEMHGYILSIVAIDALQQTTHGHQCPQCWLNIHWTIFTQKYYIDREHYYKKKLHFLITQIKLQHAIYRLYLVEVVIWTNNGTIVDYIHFLGPVLRGHGHPDSKVHWAHMGPTWVLSAPGRPHVGPMNLAIRTGILVYWSIRSHQPRWGLNQLHYIQLSGQADIERNFVSYRLWWYVLIFSLLDCISCTEMGNSDWYTGLEIFMDQVVIIQNTWNF